MTPSRQIDLCLVCWKGMQGQWEVPGLASTVDGRAQFRGLRFSRLHGPPMPVLFARVGFQVCVELATPSRAPQSLSPTPCGERTSALARR